MKYFLLLLLFFTPVLHAENEAWHVDKYCTGEVEHVNEDRTRVDCLTEDNAIEFDWGYKWAECVGQSLHYWLMTGKDPGCFLLLEDEDDLYFVDRVQRLYIELNYRTGAINGFYINWVIRQ